MQRKTVTIGTDIFYFDNDKVIVYYMFIGTTLLKIDSNQFALLMKNLKPKMDYNYRSGNHISKHYTL